jgi:hypothetical protein
MWTERLHLHVRAVALSSRAPPPPCRLCTPHNFLSDSLLYVSGLLVTQIYDEQGSTACVHLYGCVSTVSNTGMCCVLMTTIETCLLTLYFYVFKPAALLNCITVVLDYLCTERRAGMCTSRCPSPKSCLVHRLTVLTEVLMVALSASG